MNTGIINLFAGTLSVDSPSGFNGPTLTSSIIVIPSVVFIDTVGNLFVNEYNSGRIRKTVLGSDILTTYVGFVGK